MRIDSISKVTLLLILDDSLECICSGRGNIIHQGNPYGTNICEREAHFSAYQESV